MLIKEIVSALRGRIKEVTGDNIYTNKMLWFTILTVKKLLIERNRWTLSNQDITYTVSQEPEEAEPCLGCGVDRLFRLRTPYVLSTKLGPAFLSVGSEDGFVNFKVVPKNSFYRKIRINNKSKYAYFEDGYLYFIEYLPCISATYLAEAKPSGCSMLDADACIPDELQEPVLRMAVESLGYALSKPQDMIQNKNPNQ